MIERYGWDDFRLTCDNCGKECDEIFESFRDAVDYKTDRDNGWASVIDTDGEWTELCPSCNEPAVIAALKGIRPDVAEITQQIPDLFKAAFEGF